MAKIWVVHPHQAEVLIEITESEIQEETAETIETVILVAVIETRTVVATETAIVETKIAAVATKTESAAVLTTKNLQTDRIRENDLREREVRHQTSFTKRKEQDGIRCRQVSRSSLSPQSSSLL